MTTHDDRAPAGVQSVDRAISILDFLADNEWSGVTDIGNELGVHKSTAFRLLSTLERRGLVEQHTDSGKYRLGAGLTHLARAVTAYPTLSGAARAGCEWLARRTEETVTLTVLEGAECVTVDQIASTSMVASRDWLGRHTPVHCTSPGKVFLAYLPDDEREKLLREDHVRYTDGTLTSIDDLRAEIERVRAQGLATTVDEYDDGLSSAAAPVRNAEGVVVAAIGISGPSYRLEDDQLPALAERVRKAANLASRRLGHRA